jgi:hypothetical protein
MIHNPRRPTHPVLLAFHPPNRRGGFLRVHSPEPEELTPMSARVLPAEAVSVSGARQIMGASAHRVFCEALRGTITPVIVPGFPIGIDRASCERWAREAKRPPARRRARPAAAGK